jgi:hypothetical protein
VCGATRGRRRRRGVAALTLKRSFWRDPIDNGQMIDLTITWCKVNATKKIREFCLMGTISSE